ncbi:transposase [Nocardiopsis gilva]
MSRFRAELYTCLTTRPDEVFDLCDALTCAPGPAHHLAQLSLEPEHRRGHGSAYAAVNRGRIDIARLRWSLTALPLPRFHGRVVLAADISPWLRPDAWTSPQRSWCHTYGRGTGQAEMVPGWPYSVIVALEEGSTSWTAPLDIWRLLPGQDATTATAEQVRGLVDRLVAAGHHQSGDADVFCKQNLGWNTPRLRGPEAADRWSWVVMAAYTQLRLARCLAREVRLPWQRPAPPGRMTPARVRRGFRGIHADLHRPAGAPELARPGPGRPAGSRDERPAPRYGVPKKNKTGTKSLAGHKQAGQRTS